MAEDPGIKISGGWDMADEDRVRIGISSCLLGKCVRYDGGHKLDRFLTDILGRYVDYIPVCPEVECGLPVPRETMRLQGDPSNPVLVTVPTGADRTRRLDRWGRKRIRELEAENLSGFIFKSGSPSCGIKGVRVFENRGGSTKRGVGLFARAFMEKFPLIPIEEDSRLQEPVSRENFIEAVITLGRLRRVPKSRKTLGALMSFHERHKLLILSHSRKYCVLMGNLVAGGGRDDPRRLFTIYGKLLIEAMNVKPTRGKNTDVLLHAAGYFKGALTRDEKQVLLEVIEHHRMGSVPLVVPLALIRHYIRKYDQSYLKGQVFFYPHPLELVLRYHV